MIYLLYFFICIAATTLGAISGIGGGVIIKPVFDAVSGLSVSEISFLSGCTVLAMSVVSVLRSIGGEAKIDKGRGTFLAVGSAAGGVLGKLCFDLIKDAAGNDGLVGSIQSVLMIVLTFGVFLYVLNKSRIKTKNFSHPLLCLTVGLLLGVLSSFLGIGGGPINLVVLYYFFSMDTKTAAINSIYMILFAQVTSFISTVATASVPQSLDWVALAVMVAGGILGGFVGRAFSKRMQAKQVDALFRVLIIVITLISCYNLYRYIGMC